MGLTYVVGVQSSARLWPPGAGPLPPKPWTGQGRPPTLMRRDAQNQPQSAEQLAKSLPADAWRDVAWREGVDKTLRSRFAAVRVRPAHRDYWRSHPYAEEWLLVEWPQDESAPTKYWLSTLPADTPLATLAELPNCAGGSSATIPRSEQSATSNRQSQASALGWPEVSPGDCPDALLPKSQLMTQ
jgi:SRSO17 transposase